MNVVDSVIPTNPAFMNTQLFFNPINPAQKDFWHRDCQYDRDHIQSFIIIIRLLFIYRLNSSHTLLY